MREMFARGRAVRTTFLKHTLADGSWHVDWLIEVDPGDQPRVPTFRLADRPDRPGSDGSPLSRFDAELLPHHRRLYLDYSGEISGNRGRVSQLATGRVIRIAGWPGELDLTVKLAGKHWRWLGRRINGPTWRFEALPADD